MMLRKAEASTDVLLKAMAERQDALERQLGALLATVQSLEKRLTEREMEPDFSVQEGTVEVLVAGEAGATQEKRRGMKAEVKAVIAAAAAVAGEMGKVRRIRALPATQDAGSAWSQQGRVGVVSSHRLR